MKKESVTARVLNWSKTGIVPALLFLLVMASAGWAAPTVTGVWPPNGDTPPASTLVTATFSEAMNPATIAPGNFVVSRYVGIKAIAAYSTHSVALKPDGTVVAWGWNDYGSLDVPVGLTGVVAVANGGALTVALKSDGTVVAWGDNTYGQRNVPGDLSEVAAITAGAYHTVALKSNGTVVAWGLNNYGQSKVPDGLSGVVAISAGDYHTVALKNDGTVVAWGWNGDGECTVPETLSGVVAISAGGYHTVALKSDGTVVAWGANYDGQCNVPLPLVGVTAIAAGYNHTVALKSDGTVAAWGENVYGESSVPGTLTGVVAIAAGAGHTVALKSDGTVVAWGENNYSECDVPSYESPIEGTVVYDSQTLTAIFTPTNLLTSGVPYLATASTGLRGSTGVPLAADVSWSFTAAYTLDITNISLSNGGQGIAYSQTLIATGGKLPYVWSISVGALPVGLTLNATTGVISGTPTATTDNNAFTVKVMDANNSVTTKGLSIKVPSLAINTTSLVDGYLTTPYSQTLAASGGKVPYTWAKTSGSLPAGLTLNGATAIISGTPTKTGSSGNIIFQVTDNAGVKKPITLTITIYALPTISTPSLPTGTVGTSYSQTLVVTGGKTAYTWSLSVNSLPAGLVLNAKTGVISGTPTAAGSYSFTAMVSDNNGKTATKPLSITINPALPDLIVAAVSGPPSGTRGATITVTATVINQGLGRAAGSTLTFYLSTDATITTSDTKLGDVTINALGGDASQPVSVTFTMPSTLSRRTYYIGAIADRAGAVAESNETNNAKAGNAIAAN